MQSNNGFAHRLLQRLLLTGLLSLAAAAQSTVHYLHTDVLGSVVAETDAAGNVVSRRDYEPYGQQLTPVVQDGPGYTGHVQDAATGLTYMQQRYYDPGIGVFLSVDPVGAYEQPVGQFNRYRYANSNPYKFTDPDGKLAFLVPVVVIAWRAYSAYDTVTSVADNASTLADSDASTGDRIAAGAELAGSLVGGKAGRNVAGGAARMASKAGDVAKTGRGAGHLMPDPKAAGAHATLKTNADGKVTGYAEWSPNRQNPSGFDQVKRVDTQHANPHTHHNKATGESVPTPHAHERAAPGGSPSC